jgi:hypothetical protein
MSIVVAILELPKDIVLFADRKRTYRDKNDMIVRSDEMKKIFKINDHLACGITGDAVWGSTLAAHLQKVSVLYPSELISFIKAYPVAEGSTITLIGLYDDHKPFIFGYATEGVEKLYFQNCQSVATSPIEYVNQCNKYLSGRLDSQDGFKLIIQDTIRFASELNPSEISDTFNSIHFHLENDVWTIIEH